MILTKLTINDFGVFRGQHTMDLSPRDRRPIILFGGKNGAGKSTILEALRLCLYGTGALGVAVSKEDYLRFLDSKIHTNPNALIQPTFASIRVEFRYSHAEGLAAYSVARSWERKGGNKVSEFLSVERNGKTLEEVEAQSWQDFIRELIPPGVSQLFFFDGEKIQQLAEDTTDQQALADAIKSLLGVDIVERLQADLRLHLSRLAKPGRDNSYLPQIRGLERTIDSLKQKINTFRQQRTQQEGKLQELRTRITRAENNFASRGGVFARNRDQLIQQEAALKERISQLEETVRQHCAGLLPFTLVPQLCAKVKNQLALEEQSAQIKAGQTILLSAKSELTKRLSRVELLKDLPGLEEKAKNQIHTRISRALREPLRVEQIQPADNLHQLSDATSRILATWIDQATSDIAKTISHASSELERAHRELLRVAEALRKIPTDDVLKPILEEIHGLNLKLVKASTDAILKDQATKELELELAECERRHAQLAQKHAAEAKYSGKLHLLPRVQSTLEEYRLKLIENKVAHLQEAVTECFNLLCRKKDSLRKIRIDSKTFSITLCDRHNSPLPKTQLSAGEKQIYAISMLWALGKTSGRPLPIVIDTPLARLDSDHRRLLVEHYFPLASHQVIMLSTDTEVDQLYFDALNPVIARAYHLDYDQVEGTTLVRQGYFWRERDEAYKAAAN
jgi:DNA sulfur modification protein DndD